MVDQSDQDRVEQAIIENATGPASSEVDGVKATQHNLKDLIELDRYLAAKAAARSGGLGIILKKLVPPGTT